MRASLAAQIAFRGLNTPAYSFSIKNYMKTYLPSQVTRHHGRMRVDEYAHTFEDQGKLDQFIKGEEEHYARWQKEWASRTHKYVENVYSRKDTRTESTPEILGDYQYYTRVAWHNNREYTVILRKKLGSNVEEEVLDIMKYPRLRRFSETIELTSMVFSPCHQYLAFGLDLHNNEETCFMLKNIGKDHIVGVKGWEDNKLTGVDNIVFLNNPGKEGLGIFYTKMDNKHRPCELWFQDIPTGETRQIYSQSNEQYFLDISMAKDDRHLILSANSKAANKVWLLDTHSSKLSLKPLSLPILRQEEEKPKIYVNSCGRYFIIWSDSVASGNQIYGLEADGKTMKLLHQAGQDETIADIDVFSDHVVLYMRKVVSPVLRVIDLPKQAKEGGKEKGAHFRDIQLPYQIGTVSAGGNKNLHAGRCLVYFNNLFVYSEGYELDLAAGSLTLVQEFVMTGPKFRQKDYIVKVHEVPSLSGCTIPLTTIVPKKQKNVRNKTLLHCYGYYGLPYQVEFNSTYWSALEEGWTLAYAHVRGGNEKGRKWHEEAIQGGRAASWEDLQDCVAFLLKEEYTHPSILVLVSHSAGAITVWNAMNRNPHLYKAAVMNYPFLDVLSMLLDSSKPLSQSDYAQFGNPVENADAYHQIESYSPYETIHTNKDYPFLYIVGGTNDYRCPLDQIAKFVAKFRKYRPALNQQDLQSRFVFGEKGILLRVNSGSHEGLADLSQQTREGCEILASMDCLLESKSKDVSSMI